MRIVWNSNHIRMQYNRFEDRLRERLSGAEITPNPEIWEHIRQGLNQTPPPKRNRGGLVLLFLCLCGIIGYYFYPEKKPAIANYNQTSAPKKEVKGVATETPTPPKTSELIPLNAAKKEAAREVTQNVIIPPKTSPSIKSPSTYITKKAITATKNNVLSGLNSEISSLPRVSVAVFPDSVIPPIAIVTTTPEKNISEEEDWASVRKEKTEIGAKEIITIATLDTPMSKGKSASLDIQAEKVLGLMTNSTVLAKEYYGQKKWETSLSGGFSMIAYKPLLSDERGRIINPLSVNTIGITDLYASGDSAQSVNVSNPQIFNEVTSGDFDADFIKMTVSPITYFAGLGVIRNINERLYIESGIKLHYQQARKVSLPVSKTFNFYQALLNTKNSVSTISGKRENDYHFYVVEVPLTINFRLPIRQTRSAFSFGAGGSYRMLMNSLLVDKNPVNAVNNTTIASRSAYTVYQEQNLTLSSRAMYEYSVNRGKTLFVAGNIQALIRPMYNRNISYRHPILLGLETGVRF